MSQMEQEELELIKRLKNTQMKQQAAFQELEDALQTKSVHGRANAR